MNRHRDHLAPSDLTDGQLEGIRNVDRIITHIRESSFLLSPPVRFLPLRRSTDRINSHHKGQSTQTHY
jgi:hypothetical protein